MRLTLSFSWSLRTYTVGAYSSERLDLAQRPDPLVRILASYALMSDEEAEASLIVRLFPLMLQLCPVILGRVHL